MKASELTGALNDCVVRVQSIAAIHSDPAVRDLAAIVHTLLDVTEIQLAIQQFEPEDTVSIVDVREEVS